MQAFAGDVLRDILLGLAETTDLAGLAARIMPPLTRAIRSSIGIVHREHPGGGEGGPTPAWEAVTEAYRPYVASCPLQQLKRRMPERVAVLTDLVDPHARRSSPVFHDCFARFDSERQLVANVGHVAAGELGSTVLILARSRRHPAFTGSDVSLVRQLVPALTAAIARNDRWAALHAAADAGGPPQIAFDASGRALWLSRAAERLLTGRVPAALALAARRVACMDRAAPLHARLGPGRTALLCRTESASGAPLVIATIDAGQPLSPAELAARYQLTRAETRVLAALACGSSNAEIAEHLGIARGTVRIHLSRIYGKLDVTSRTQALVKIRRS